MRPSRCAPAALSEVRLKSVLLQVVEDSGDRHAAIRRTDVEPPHAWIAPPPSQLSSCVLAVRLRHPHGQLFQGELAADVCECLGIADPCEDWRGCRNTGLQSAFGLGDQPALNLRPAALLESLVDDLKVSGQADTMRRPSGCIAFAQRTQR